MANTYTTGPANIPNYNALVNKVYDWANRDIDALPVTIVQDALRYAADTAYRTLRVPPLEATTRWSRTALDAVTVGAGNVYQSVTPLAIPNDLIEFIHIRGTDVNGLTTRVFNEKTDIRSFWDICTDHYNLAAFWSRQGNNVLLTPSFGNAARGFYGGGSGPEEMIEMFYYKRLPALNATYDVTVANFMGGSLEWLTSSTGSDGSLWFPTGTATDAAPAVTLTPTLAQTTDNTVQLFFRGNEVPNWLKDENEKVVLMGALGECFAYLQEDDQSQKYFNLFTKEIADLNDEDRMRDASGGNVQTQYTAYGLI